MEKQPKRYFLYFAAFTINFIVFGTGICFSWTSPFLPKFESNDSSINPISRPVTTTEGGMLVSMASLGLLVGPMIPPLMTEKLGKKTTLLLTTIPLLVAHIMCSLTKQIEVFLIARFIMGLVTGAAWTIVPSYIGEISEPNNRGLLSSLISVLTSGGNLFACCVGPFLSMKWFSIVNMTPVVIFLIFMFFFVPESPYDLVRKNQIKRAEESLIKLRQKSNVDTELAVIKKSIEADHAESDGKLIDLLRSPVLIRAMKVSVGVMIVSPLSGIVLILGYTQTIFDLSESPIPSSLAAIIVLVISLFTTMVHSYLVDRLGRKILIIVSCGIVFLALSGLGTFFYLQDNNFNVDSITWLPLFSLILYMFGYYLGVGVVPYIIVGELFPSNVKALATGLCTTINFSIVFLLTLIFPYLLQFIGAAYTFWLLALFMAVGIIFCITVVPETRGKSLQEITEMLNHGKEI